MNDIHENGYRPAWYAPQWREALNEWVITLTGTQLVDMSPKVWKAIVKAHVLVLEANELHASIETVVVDELTAMYIALKIHGKLIKVLTDSGAACTCISQDFLLELGIAIDGSSDAIFMLRDGKQLLALGIVYDLDIQVDGLTIPIDAIVIPMTVYHLILDRNWLKKAQAVLNYHWNMLKVQWCNLSWQVAIRMTEVQVPVKGSLHIHHGDDESNESESDGDDSWHDDDVMDELEYKPVISSWQMELYAMIVEVLPILQGILDNDDSKYQLLAQDDVIIDGLNLIKFSVELLHKLSMTCYLEINDELSDLDVSIVKEHKGTLVHTMMIEVYNCNSLLQRIVKDVVLAWMVKILLSTISYEILQLMKNVWRR